jgi:hypothetical protein
VALLVALVVAARGDDKNVIKVDPEAFAAEIKADAKAVAAKYKGKLIEMTGTVAGIYRNFGDVQYVGLPSKTAGTLGVTCVTKDQKLFGKVFKGQEVTVRGKYPDPQYGYQIEDCEIVKKGPSPALTYTADEMAAEWARDKEAATKKWKDKPIVVSGLIVESKVNDVGAVNVYLKAPNKKRVDCGFTAFEKEIATKLQTGTTVKFVGEFVDFESKDEEPALRFCMPVKE